jgi:type I restriction enzyme M protein
MNLAIRGISCDLGEIAADTFSKDQHPNLKADFILANPPFNLKDWRERNDLLDDSRWAGYEVPPVSNANYGWILHMISKLSLNGVAGFLLANGALADPDTRTIRQQILENNLVEAIVVLPREMFYSTDISVTLWIINKNKKSRSGNQNGIAIEYRDRQKEVLFIDLRRKGVEFEKKFVQLTDIEITQIVDTYHSWQRNDTNSKFLNIPEFCYSASLDEIREKEYSLIPSKYIEFVDKDSKLNFSEEMPKISRDIRKIVEEEKLAHIQLADAFLGLGYDIDL